MGWATTGILKKCPAGQHSTMKETKTFTKLYTWFVQFFSFTSNSENFQTSLKFTAKQPHFTPNFFPSNNKLQYDILVQYIIIIPQNNIAKTFQKHHNLSIFWRTFNIQNWGMWNSGKLKTYWKTKSKNDLIFLYYKKHKSYGHNDLLFTADSLANMPSMGNITC